MWLFGTISNTGVIQIPLVLLLIVGLLAFGGWRRHPGWWLMAAGILELLLAYISQIFLLQVATGTLLMDVMIQAIKLREVGLLAFALGFAALGALVAGVHRRQVELDGSPEAKPEKKKGGRGA